MHQSDLPFTEAGQCLRHRRLDPEGDHPETTFNLSISDADSDAVPQQIRDVEEFLRAHQSQISELLNRVSGSKGGVDFLWGLPSEGMQYNIFPVSLLSLLAALRIKLKVTVYGMSADTHPSL